MSGGRSAICRQLPDPRDDTGEASGAMGWVYDGLTHRIRFQGAAKKQAFLAKIDITYEEHM